MAIAGLQNVSVLDSSFRRESQPPLSGQWADHDRLSTRPSTLLQMWRELEGEHVVGHSQLRVGDRLQEQRIDASNADLENAPLSERQDSDNRDGLGDGDEIASEYQTWSQGQIRLQNEHEDGNSSSSEQFTDFGEVERERVRQTFQEWMNSGVRDHSSDVSHGNSSCSRAPWLGDNECERVRIIREWARMTSQQRGTFGGTRQEHAAQIGAQIERVRDGFVVNEHEVGAQRNIRRLCGRQALVDLLAKAERERKRELENLLEHQPVSNFAHRNRIQSLLRGRFLQSGRLVRDERPCSVASSELGLLRQRHTVSGLREGFLSRLDNAIPGAACNFQFDTSSDNDNFISGPASNAQSDPSSDKINEQTHINSSLEDLDATQAESEPSNGERYIDEFHPIPLERDIIEDINCLERDIIEETNWQESNAEEQQVRHSENEEREQQLSSNSESTGRRNGVVENAGGNWVANIANEWSQGTSGNEGEEQAHQQHYEPSGEEQYVRVLPIHADGYESNTYESIRMSHTSAVVDERQNSITDNEDSDWQHLENIEFSGWTDGTTEVTDGNWGESPVNLWYQEMSGSERDEDRHLQELHGNDLQVAMNNLLEGPSIQEAAPIGRSNSFYFPDDDNVYSTEIRELLSRRSVSNLLQSDFRENLNQLIQSYVERQAHASVDWELDSTLPSPRSPALMEQDVQQSGDLNLGQSDAVERTDLALPSPAVIPSQPFWDQGLHHNNWSPNHLHQHLGIEWEIINDLRIDMDRLQQRMNNMQRLLEACMDMQLELQRSVRQEVSAALNMSANSTEEVDKTLPMDESKWDRVRKGLCCICCNSNIDSLLYRCGHMCTCSNCADKLVQGRGKCPMCRAPVVEMIRAYFIQ